MSGSRSDDEYGGTDKKNGIFLSGGAWIFKLGLLDLFEGHLDLSRGRFDLCQGGVGRVVCGLVLGSCNEEGAE